MRTTALLVSVLLYGGIVAQDFDFSAKIPPVTESGYHAIILSPELLGRSSINNADIRLKDAEGRNVPFIIQRDEAVSMEDEFIQFNIIRNEIIPNEYTVIEIQPTHRSQVSQINLKVANANVTKNVVITGSDDRKQWYAVQARSVQIRPQSDGETSSLSVMNLPRTQHTYYRITIGDSLSAPLKVLDIGHQGRSWKLGNYSEATGYKIRTDLEESITKLWIASSYPLNIDRIALDILGPAQYHREFVLYEFETLALTRKQRRRGAESTRRTPITKGVLSSDSKNVFSVEGLRADTLVLEIYNEDDAPLEIGDIHLEQLDHRLVTLLDAGATYSIVTGNAELDAPRYDFGRFVNSETEILSHFHHAPLTDHRKEKGGALSGIGKHWMWLLIGGLTVFMLIMVARLMRDEKTKVASK